MVVAVGAIDNLLKGAAGQAVQNLNAMNGWDEVLGLDGLAARRAMRKKQRENTARLRVFGDQLRHQGRAQGPGARLQRSAVRRRRVLHGQRVARRSRARRRARLPAAGMRAIVANSGNANALVGPDGERDVREVCEAVGARRSGSCRRQGAGARRPGVIGVPLAGEQARRGRAAARAASRGGAIEHGRTGDHDHRHAREAGEPRRDAWAASRRRIAAFAKGSGMIAPELATMLAFLTTDLAVTPAALQSALAARCHAELRHDHRRRRHEHERRRLRAGQRPRGQRAHRGRQRRDTRCSPRRSQAICIELARQIAEDGEGATKLVEVRVARCARRSHRARSRARRGRLEPGEGRHLRRRSRTGVACSSAIGARVGSRRWRRRPARRADRHASRARASTTGGAPTGVDAAGPAREDARAAGARSTCAWSRARPAPSPGAATSRTTT